MDIDFNRQLKQLVTYINTISRRFVLKPPSSGADLELSHQETKMIGVIGAKGPAIMRDVAQALNLPLSTATNTIDKLVGKARVERTRVDEDRRIVQVTLSEKGWQLYQEFLECQMGIARDMLEALSPGEREIFLELMAKMTVPQGSAVEP